MNDRVNSKWEDFLNPEILRGKLISASIFLAAFEMLKDSIVSRVKDFFSSGFDLNGAIIGPRYEQEVLSRSRSELYASLAWLRHYDVITDKDLERFERIKECRNKTAHELPQIIAGGSFVDIVETFPEMVELLKKVEVWWIANVEIPTNPDFDNVEINEEDITPGSLITLKIMFDLALGSEEEAYRYLKHFQETKGQK